MPGTVDFIVKKAVAMLQEEKFDAAESLLLEALESGMADGRIAHLRGLTAVRRADMELAEKMLRLSCRFDPHSTDALTDLGNILEERGNTKEAETAYRNALRLSSTHPLAGRNLGAMLLKNERFADAIQVLKRHVQNNSGDAVGYFCLGQAQEKSGDTDGALGSFRKTIDIDRGHVDAHQALFGALRRQEHLDEAQEVLKRWLQIDPENVVAQHLASSLSQEISPDRASDAYVREVFDKFAGTFEVEINELGYQGPKLIHDALVAALGEPSSNLRILDAGCGTGLCGPFLKPYASHLCGVDLSPKMLAKAHEKNVYDRLVVEEFGHHCRTHPAKYDLIIAADTIIYIGDLRVLFKEARHAISGQGHFLFTAETGDHSAEGGFRLNSTGRYTHTESYVCTCLQDNRWQIESIRDETLRIEAGREVKALVVVAKC